MPRGSPPESNDFYLVIEGLPRDFTWQHLKDEAKRIAHQVGWTEMSVYSGEIPYGCGQVRLRRRKDAVNLYNYWMRNGLRDAPLKLQLWDTTRCPPVLLGRNVSSPRVGDFGSTIQSTMRRAGSHASWRSFQPTSPEEGMVRRPAYGPSATAASYNQPVQVPSAVTRSTQGRRTPNSISAPSPYSQPVRTASLLSRVPSQMSSMSATSTRYAAPFSLGTAMGYVNAARGVLPMKRHTIHISGVDQRETAAVYDMIERTEGLVNRSLGGGGWKEHFLAEYVSHDAAYRAIEALHGKEVGSFVLQVKFAQEPSISDDMASSEVGSSATASRHGGRDARTSSSGRSRAPSRVYATSSRRLSGVSRSEEDLEEGGVPVIVNGSRG